MVAETEPLARRAAKAVKVTYEDLPAIISIEDAIEANSCYEQYHGDSLVSGDLEAGFAGAHIATACEDRNCRASPKYDYRLGPTHNVHFLCVRYTTLMFHACFL